MGTPGRPLYDAIGQTYASVRTEDPAVAAQVHAALGDAGRVVNVGAGSGSYEPRDRDVVAVEPSPTMIEQRRPDAAPVVRASAEALPFPARSFDAAMAVLTVHHWPEVAGGLAELRRVAGRQVVLFFEPLAAIGFWLVDYFPEIADLPTERAAPGVPDLAAALDVVRVEPVLVPPDCRDGFTAAYWCRPEAYLEPVVQAGMSSLALLPEAARVAGTDRLRTDLASGAWEARHGHLRQQATFDGGYRLAVAEG